MSFFYVPLPFFLPSRLFDLLVASDTCYQDSEGKKDEEMTDVKGEKEIKEPEPSFEVKCNPARVLVAQIGYLKVDEDSRYVPVDSGKMFGITVLRDTKPNEPVVLVSAGDEVEEPSADLSSALQEVNADEEPEAPEAFTFEG